MTAPAPDVIEAMIRTAVFSADQARPRAQQRAQGIIGPSAIGFCRQAALLTLKGVEPSDPQDAWSAIEGTIIGEKIEHALKQKFPDWIVGSIDQRRVEASLRNGAATIGGTPDIIVPAWNAVLDIKTKDGLGEARRPTWPQSYDYQTWLYVLGAAQAGILDPTKPLYQGLVYVDRSASEEKWLHVPPLREWSPALEDPIYEWIADVVYAAKHGEDASQDIPAPVCERICEFFSVCRGALPVGEVEIIDDEFRLEAIVDYTEASKVIKEQESRKKAARHRLVGTNGNGGGYQVRTTEVPESREPGNLRTGYTKIDVRPIRRRSA